MSTVWVMGLLENTDNSFDRDIQKKIIDPKYGSDLVELKDFKPSFILLPTQNGQTMEHKMQVPIEGSFKSVGVLLLMQ